MRHRSETNHHRPPRRRAAPAVVLVAASALALAACGTADAQGPPTVSTSAGPLGAPEAARIGAAGSACELPVTFGLAESWQAKAVTIAPDSPLAELARQGPLTMVCEIDAKPAGSIGFLRVWTGPGSDPRSSLAAFIGTGAHEPTYTESRIGDSPAVEVVYQRKDPLDDAMNPERAFAVRTAQGIAAVSLDSMDSAEHTDMLPAYHLARTSLTVTH